MAVPTPVLELIEVSRRFRAGIAGCSAEVTALDRVSLRVARAECVGVVGGPGAGKTTLLLCAAGLLIPDSGSVRAPRSAFVASLEALSETDPVVRAVLFDPGVAPRDGSERDAFGCRVAELRAAGAAIVIAARHPLALHGVATRIVTLARGRGGESHPSRRTLELEVGMPGVAAAILAVRLPSVQRHGRALRVPLERVSAEEVLSACVALGIRVDGSRVIVEEAARIDRVAERSEH